MLSNQDIDLDTLHITKPRIKFDLYYGIIQIASIVIGFISDIRIPYILDKNQAVARIIIAISIGVIFILIRFSYDRSLYYKKLEINFFSIKQYAEALKVRLSISKKIYSLTNPSRIMVDIKEAVLQNRTIVIKLEKSNSIAIGDEIVIYDQENDNVIGEYAITSSNNTFWIASPNGEVDPVWLGYYIGQGLSSITLSAYVVAFKK